MDDATLVLAARSGDRDALAAIYDRYADRLHDFCSSILRDRDEAADAFHDAFLAAARRLDQLRDPDKLRPWLFAIARHEALRRAKARSRQQPTHEVDDVTASVEPELDEGARRQEAVELVWAAAAGLADRDRALLDLNLRQGLDGQDLADAIGVEPSHAYVLLNRLRAQVERSLGALLIARYGRSHCGELAAILKGWDGRFTPLLRKRVARHADQCEICGERRSTLASPLALLGAIPLTPAPSRLRDAILGDVQLAAAGTGRPWKSDAAGFPPPAYQSRPSRPATALVAAVALVIVSLAALLLVPDEDRRDLSVAAGQPTTTTVGGAAGAAGAAPTPTATTPTGEGVPTPPTGTVDPAAAGEPTNPVAPGGGGGGAGSGGGGGGGGGNAGTRPPETVTTTVLRAVQPQLRLGTTSLDFGATATSQALTIANDGDGPLAWSVASIGPSAFSISPAGGTVEPGGTARATVRLDRGAAAEGRITGSVRISSDGGNGSVGLSASVALPPSVRATSERATVGRAPCSVQSTFASVMAEASDESGVDSVVLRWRDPTGATGSRALAAGGDSTWSGRLGSYSAAGTVTWWVEATDNLGNTGRSPNQTMTVNAC